MPRSENTPHDGHPCQRKKENLYCLKDMLAIEQNVYSTFWSVYILADAFEHMWYTEVLPEQAQNSQGENACIAVLSGRWNRIEFLNTTVSCRIPLTPP